MLNNCVVSCDMVQGTSCHGFIQEFWPEGGIYLCINDTGILMRGD